MIEWALIIMTSNAAVAEKWGSNSLKYDFTTEQQCITARNRFLAVGHKRREREMRYRLQRMHRKGPDPISQITRTLVEPQGPTTAECLKRHVVRPKTSKNPPSALKLKAD